MLYVDTSVLVAFYIPEAKSEKAENLLTRKEQFAISSLTEVEFNSAVSRRVRMKEISREIGHCIIAQFNVHLKDRRYYLFPVMQREYELARDWLGNLDSGLRTLDAIHLAVAFCNQHTLVTADAAFGKSARSCGITVKMI